MLSVLNVKSQSLVTVCDDIAEELLLEAGWAHPPVDAFSLAEILGYDVAFDARQGTRGRLKRLAGRPTVFLSPDDRPERLQWAAAHEIGEGAAFRVFDRLGLDPLLAPEKPPRADRFPIGPVALLPRRQFAADVRRTNGDLSDLKARYATASHELILMSQLRMDTLLLASIFDHGSLTRRRTNGRLAPRPS